MYICLRMLCRRMSFCIVLNMEKPPAQCSEGGLSAILAAAKQPAMDKTATAGNASECSWLVDVIGQT